MKARGFTLIELMIAVAIIGILALIAYPSYRDYVLRTHRTAAQGCLMEMAQWMERYYTTRLSYEGATLPQTQCRTDIADRYEISFAPNSPTATTFTLQATPRGAQQEDACGTLTLDQSGVRNPPTAGCWRR